MESLLYTPEKQFGKLLTITTTFLSESEFAELTFATMLFNDVWYMMDSEMPLERRFADLTMLIRSYFRRLPLYDFIIEFKYLKLSEVKLSGAELKKLSITELEALEPVTEKLKEAKQQLLDYQSRLEEKSDDRLKLQLISVVAVGFERVVWQMVAKQ